VPGGHRAYVHDGGRVFIFNGIELAVCSAPIVRDTGPYAGLCVSRYGLLIPDSGHSGASGLQMVSLEEPIPVGFVLDGRLRGSR